MTNAEKYKTVLERVDAFQSFCKEYHDCDGCPFEDKIGTETNVCALFWLNAETEEDGTLPCPFCGGRKIKLKLMEDMSDGYMSQPQIYCCRCGATLGLDWDRTTCFDGEMTEDQKEVLLKMWNTRAVTNANEVAK